MSKSAQMIILLLGGAFLLAACSTSSEALSTAGTATNASAPGGDAAPDFELEVFGNEDYTKGETVKLSQFVGQPVVINFWYPSCPPCRLEMPDLEAAFQKHRDDVAFIGVQLLGLDSADDGQEFTDEFGMSYAIGPDADSSIVVDYKVIGFPTSVFLNSDHEIMRKWTGALNAEKLEELVQELLE